MSEECIPTHYGDQVDEVGTLNAIPCLMQEDHEDDDPAYLLKEDGCWFELELVN